MVQDLLSMLMRKKISCRDEILSRNRYAQNFFFVVYCIPKQERPQGQIPC